MERKPAETFRDLIVWAKAHELVLQIYRASDAFPKREVYGLISQLRRAAVSVPSNIAEGFKKRGGFDKARFLNIAQGSLEEARYLLILAQDLGFGPLGPLLTLTDEVGRVLGAYTNRVLESCRAPRRL